MLGKEAALVHQCKVTTEELFMQIVRIYGKEAHHLCKVVRASLGENITLFDGLGEKRKAKIMEITEESVLVQIEETLMSNTEPPCSVTLYQALPKGDKFEWILQKSVELGVTKIVPLLTRRTVVKLDKEKGSRKQKRWQTIALEACKQSGRSCIPEVSDPISYTTALLKLGVDVAIMPYEKKVGQGIKRVIREMDKRSIESIGIFIGPEGGWDNIEVDQAIEAGVIPVSMGPRILRSETASLAAITIVLYELGDLGGSSDDA